MAPSAVRFYEAHGLITSERTAGNQRRFHESDACRIKVIRVAQRIGLSVAEIRKRLDGLPLDPSVADWQRLTKGLHGGGHPTDTATPAGPQRHHHGGQTLRTPAGRCRRAMKDKLTALILSNPDNGLDGYVDTVQFSERTVTVQCDRLTLIGSWWAMPTAARPE